MVAIARKPDSLRAIILFSAVGSMAAGIHGGLIRLGLPLGFGPELAVSHGPIMVCGLFGTLISLERAVAMARSWPYLAPALFAIGSGALIAGAPALLAGALFTGGAAILTLGSLVILRQQPALFTLALLGGATGLLVGNAMWTAGAPVPDLVGWWLAFLVCTIAAERLELSRMLRPPATAWPGFVAALVLLFLGAAAGLTSGIGGPAMGLSLFITTAWLLRHDIAMTTIRKTGATRFFAAAMLAGYVWLGLAGVLLLAGSALPLRYDLVLHAVFIGFVISMVFGHALIILPAVTGIKLRYHWTLYLPLVLLHLSVVLRIAGGLFEAQAVRTLSGPVTAASLVLFAATLILLACRRQPATSSHRQTRPAVSADPQVDAEMLDCAPGNMVDDIVDAPR